MGRLFGRVLAGVSCLAYIPMFVMLLATGETEIYRALGFRSCSLTINSSALAIFTVPLAFVAGPFCAHAAKRLWFISAVSVVYPILLQLVFDGLLKNYVLRGPMPSWATFLDPLELLQLIAIIMVTTLAAQAVRERRHGEGEQGASRADQEA